MFLLLFCHHWLSFKLSGVGLDLEPKMIESTNVVTQDKLGSVNTRICTLHHAVPVHCRSSHIQTWSPISIRKCEMHQTLVCIHWLTINAQKGDLQPR